MKTSAKLIVTSLLVASGVVFAAGGTPAAPGTLAVKAVTNPKDPGQTYKILGSTPTTSLFLQKDLVFTLSPNVAFTADLNEFAFAAGAIAVKGSGTPYFGGTTGQAAYPCKTGLDGTYATGLAKLGGVTLTSATEAQADGTNVTRWFVPAC